MALTRTHSIRERIKGEWPNRIFTHCGKEGTVERATTTEFTTLDGHDARFVAVNGWSGVNCKACLRSYERITTTRRRDHSRVGANLSQ